MADVTRRQVLQLGAGGARLPSLADARPASAAPAAVLAANDLALWYDETAGTDWLRALPIGNGRLGAMVFGNVDTERLQLNEDTVWAGGPYDSEQHPGRRRRWRRSGRLVFAEPVEPGAGPDRPDHARHSRRRSWPTSPSATCGSPSPQRLRGLGVQPVRWT